MSTDEVYSEQLDMESVREPFRGALFGALKERERTRKLLYSPPFSSGGLNIPASLLAITDSRWLVILDEEVSRIYMWNPLRERERQLKTLYPDMPPRALLVKCLGENVSVNCDEFQRAQWFWERRPNKLVLSRNKALRILLLYLLFLIISIFVHEQTPATDVIRSIAWIALAAIAVAVFVDISRYAQWKWEYCRAISRLFATVNQ